MELALVQGKIIPYTDLEPIYLDRALYYGDGVYEVIRSYGGRIFALEEHLTRFAHSIKAVAIEGADLELIRRQIVEGFTASGIANAKIYCHLTRGSADRDLAAELPQGPNFFMTITELPADSTERSAGIAVGTHPDWRWKRCDIKSLNLLPNVLARRAVEKSGCGEAILVDEDGWITEGAASAFFAVCKCSGAGGGCPVQLQTTPLTANILPSVTRAYVLKAAGTLELPVVEHSLTPAEAREAEELFIAVTTRDVIPVVRFDGKDVGDGTPGGWTRRLQQAFETFVRH